MNDLIFMWFFVVGSFRFDMKHDLKVRQHRHGMK